MLQFPLVPAILPGNEGGNSSAGNRPIKLDVKPILEHAIFLDGDTRAGKCQRGNPVARIARFA